MINAWELLNEMEGDPEYQKGQARDRQRKAELVQEAAIVAQPLIDELNAIGWEVEGVHDLVDFANSDETFPPEVVQIFLHGLETIDHDGVQMTLIRSLHGAKAPFDGSILLRLFEEGKLDRWAIAHLLASQVPIGIGDWVAEAVRNPKHGTERQPLCLALARSIPPPQSLPILRDIFARFPNDAVEAIGLVGRREDVSLLANQLPEAEDLLEALIKESIAKLRRRT